MKKRIVVVENDPGIRLNVLDLLDAEGFEGIGAENGRLGVEAAKKHLPHLIICDIMMPELDGFGVLRALREHPATASAPFIFLTARADRSDFRAGMNLGADDYLTKPFTRTDLLEAIWGRLDRQRDHSKGIKLDGALATTIGDYQITGRVGGGSTGTVLRAEHVTTGQEVAIKVLRSNTADENTTLRFVREARIIQDIDHPNIVVVLDFGSQPDGTFFLVMELLKGESLRSRLEARRSLPDPEVRELAHQLAATLTAVHARGVIHRDLKPANIFVVAAPDGRDFVKVLDFGIAKVFYDDSITGTGTILGTPLYMAPEQFQMQPVDARTDVYSLGVMLYEMAVGRPPFLPGEGGFLRLSALHQMEEPEPPRRANSAVSAALEATILRCLRKQPDERFQTMKELARSL